MARKMVARVAKFFALGEVFAFALCVLLRLEPCFDGFEVVLAH